jgi:hypothetical protein
MLWNAVADDTFHILKLCPGLSLTTLLSLFLAPILRLPIKLPAR